MWEWCVHAVVCACSPGRQGVCGCRCAAACADPALLPLAPFPAACSRPRSVLSPAVVWELYEYVLGRPPPAVTAAAQPARSSFQLQEDSDYDPYGEEEED